MERQRRADGQWLDEGELAAERAAERLGDHPDALQREVERPGQLPPRDERPLRAGRDDQRPGRLEPGGAHLRLDVRLVDPGRPERPFDHAITGGERRRDVTALARNTVEDVRRELLAGVVLLALVDLGVNRLEVAALVIRLFDDARERGAGLHRRLDVDDGLEGLVVDDEQLGAVLGCCLGLRDDERHRLSGEHDLLTRERLGGAVGSRRGDREIGGGEHGDDAGHGERGVLVEATDARVRLGREHGPRMEEAVDVAVRGVARRPGHLLRRVEAGTRDAERVAHRSSLRALARGAQGAIGDDACELAAVLGGREAVAEDLGICQVVRRARRASRPTPVTATVSSSGVTNAAAPASAKPDAGCSTDAYAEPDPGAGTGITMSVTSSCGPSAVVNGPTSASATASSRSPSGERSLRRAPSARRTAGMSDAGSAWTTLPPIVPRLRTCRSPMPRAHSPSAASAGRRSTSAPMSSFQVVSGPMCSSPSRS